MVPRFYAPELRPDSTVIVLPPEEAEHLTRVLRLAAGTEVRVFDGRGFECVARVAHAGRHDVRLDVLASAQSAPEPRVRVTLAQGLLKGDKIDDVIRDAAMIGVVAIQPLLTGRTDMPAAAFNRGGRLERWRRIAVASAKQCGRAVVPDVRPAETLSVCLERDRSDLRLMLLEPSAGGEVEPLEALSGRRPPASALVLVGPEGGWEPDEVTSARALGCLGLTLGRRTLRADAAPVIAVALLQHLWGDL